MSVHVLKDAKVTINSVVLSDHTRSVELALTNDVQDDTVMGMNTKVVIAGLNEWQFTCEFEQDFGAGSVDATLFPLLGAAAFPIKVKASSAANSATNPEYQGNAVLASYQPIKGSVGNKHIVQAVFRSAGDLTRAVA